jgi:hypothetical protein
MKDLNETLRGLASILEANSVATVLGAEESRQYATALRALLESPAADSQAPTISRDFLGQIVRDAWVKWAKQQPAPKASWLAPYAKLSEPDKEADRQIGEAVAQWVLEIKGADWSQVAADSQDERIAQLEASIERYRTMVDSLKDRLHHAVHRDSQDERAADKDWQLANVLLDIARQCAAKTEERHDYLPHDTASSRGFYPHRWVTDAMRAAIAWDRCMNREGAASTEQTAFAQAAVRMLEGYAESYDCMSRMSGGENKVNCSSVAFDIRHNMAGWIKAQAGITGDARASAPAADNGRTVEAEFEEWFDRAWAEYQKNSVTSITESKIKAKAWALKAWRQKARAASAPSHASAAGAEGEGS